MSSKRDLGWKPEIGPIPSSTKPHPLWISWPWAHLPCISWVQVSDALAIVWLFHHSLFLFSFFSTLFLLLLLNFVSFYSCIFSTCAYPLWRALFLSFFLFRLSWPFVSALPHSCLFLGLWACLLSFPARLAYWALFLSFFLFYRAFMALCFCLAPLLPLLGPVGLPAVIYLWDGPLGLISLSLFSSFYGPFIAY